MSPSSWASALPVVADTADDLLTGALASVAEHGDHVDGRRPFQELLHQQLTLTSPRHRLPINPASTFNPVVAVARFAWLVSGSDRLADIEVYETRVGAYTDDHLTVPGSSFGARLFNSSPGLDQIGGAIARLRSDPSSRRAAAVVWQPHDAVRESRDIPCTFGLSFHVRHGQLIAATSMRSNNAVRLLPYNVFEYTLLAEIVAREVGADLGPYLHAVTSLHIYDDEHAAAVELAAAAPRGPAPAMPPMPVDPSPLEQARELARWESEMQRDVVALAHAPVSELLDAAGRRLRPYWQGLAGVLLFHLLRRAGRGDVAPEALQVVPEPLRGLALRRNP